MENPPKKFFRLSPGNEVRLRYAYFITCRDVVKNADGEVVELRCTYDPATRGGNAPDGRKVKATMHWVSAADAVAGGGPALQSAVQQAASRPAASNFAAELNPNSFEILSRRLVEPALARIECERAGAVRAAGLFLPRRGSRRASSCSIARSGLRDTFAKEADRPRKAQPRTKPLLASARPGSLTCGRAGLAMAVEDFTARARDRARALAADWERRGGAPACCFRYCRERRTVWRNAQAPFSA